MEKSIRRRRTIAILLAVGSLVAGACWCFSGSSGFRTLTNWAVVDSSTPPTPEELRERARYVGEWRSSHPHSSLLSIHPDGSVHYYEGYDQWPGPTTVDCPLRSYPDAGATCDHLPMPAPETCTDLRTQIMCNHRFTMQTPQAVDGGWEMIVTQGADSEPWIFKRVP